MSSFLKKQRRLPVNKEYQTELCIEGNKTVQLKKYRIHERAWVNANTNGTEVVTVYAHTHRNACDTLTRFVVPTEIVGSGRWFLKDIIDIGK